MPQSLAEILYELGRAALEQQERQVAELRARTQALLAGAALIASFFGAAAIHRAGLNGPAIGALVVLSLSVSWTSTTSIASSMNETRGGNSSNK